MHAWSNPKPKNVTSFAFPNEETKEKTRELWIRIVSKLRR